jgi:raffinose/stachyose/melibiose transport system substrate-binding protein
VRLRWFGWILLLALVVLTSLGIGATERRVALVIGNGNYRHITPLVNPRNDAEAMTAKLESLGFSVMEAVDLQLPDLRAAVAGFERASRGADVALIFYAGHGLQVAGENYLLPVDAQVGGLEDLAPMSLRVSELYAAFGAAQPGLAVLIVDACRDNPFVKAGIGSPGLASGAVAGGGLAGGGSDGVVIAFAAAPGAYAADGTDGNSPFTTALLQWIDRPGLEIGTMFRRVRQTVVDLTGGAQVPWVEEALLDDIYLNPRDPVELVLHESESFETALLTTIRGMQDPTERSAALAFYDRLDPGGVPGLDGELQPTAAAARGDDDFMQHSLIWLSIRDSTDPAIFQAFLERFPSSAFVDLARLRLAALGGAVEDGHVPAVIGELAPLPLQGANTAPAVTGHAAAGTDASAGATTPEALAVPEPQVGAAASGEMLAPAVSPADTEEGLGLDQADRVAVQRLLAYLGHYRGPLDGAIGPASRAAIAVFQAADGLSPTGYLNQAALRRLVLLSAGPVLGGGIAGPDRAGIQSVSAIGLRGPGAEPVVIRFESINRHPPIQAYWRELADGFEAERPGVIVEMRTQPDAEYKVNLLTMLGSANPPDIFYTWGGGHMRAVSEAGFARDLTEEMGAGWAMQFKPGALENLTVNDRIYAVPFHLTLVSMWINEPLLASVGIDPAELQTWDGLLSAIETLKRAGVTPIAVGGAERWPLQFYWGSLAHSLGGRAAFDLAFAGEGHGFAGPVFVQAGALLEELVATAPFQPGYQDMTAEQAGDAFSRGEAAMTLNGSWALPRLTRMWPGGRVHGVEDIGRIDFPPADLGIGGQLTYGAVPAWMVRRDAPAEAVEFLRLLSSLEAQTVSATMGYDVPSVAGADSAIEDQLLGEVAEQLTMTDHHQLMYDMALGPQAGEVVNDAVVALVDGDLTPEETAAEVQRAWEAVLRAATPAAERSPLDVEPAE